MIFHGVFKNALEALCFFRKLNGLFVFQLEVHPKYGINKTGDAFAQASLLILCADESIILAFLHEHFPDQGLGSLMESLLILLKDNFSNFA